MGTEVRAFTLFVIAGPEALGFSQTSSGLSWDDDSTPEHAKLPQTLSAAEQTPQLPASPGPFSLLPVAVLHQMTKTLMQLLS